MLGGLGVGAGAWLRTRHDGGTSGGKSVTGTPPDVNMRVDIANLAIAGRVAVQPGARRDKRRLRLYPLGRNELAPIDVVFQDGLTLGRSPDCDICISNDSQVSAKHCTLTPEGKLILVQDEGSRNGTRLNGVPVARYLHAESDSILGVGRTEMRMRLLEAEA
jgi:hypothetical protein